MTCRRQLEANRANAKRSIGPKTRAGKARSRRNSRKHGLTASTLVIGDEDPAQFEQLRSELIEQHDPQSALEFELVERLSGLLWRLRRVPVFEAAIMDARRDQAAKFYLSEPSDEQLSPQQWYTRSLGRALIYDGAFHDVLGKLARHEATLMNAVTKTLKTLLLLQGERDNPKSNGPVIEAFAIPDKDR